MADDSEIRRILRDAEETLRTAEFGLQLVKSDDPIQRRIGVRNVVTFGRAVTNVIQKLRSVVEGFDDWYEVWQQRFRDDSITSYLYRLRSEILKEGSIKTSMAMHFDHLNPKEILSSVEGPPPGATAFFIGDHLGGSSWEVPLPNGEKEKYYVSLANVPNMTATVRICLSEAPEDVRAVPIEDVCEHYLSEMRAITDAAWKFFVK